MNLSERIANWLTAGKYQIYMDESARTQVLRDHLHRAQDRYDVLSASVINLQARLNEIAACETPNSNGTVRRMERIARGEK